MTIEPLVLEVKLENTQVILLGLYWPPRQTSPNYFSVLEDDWKNLFSWITSQKQTTIVTGDRNLDRRKPENKDDKILRELVEIYELECLIKQATRITRSS